MSAVPPSSKGQVTIPREVRDELGLVSGTAVEFLVREGEAVLRKRGGDGDPIDRVCGRLELGASVDALVDVMRGPGPTANPERQADSPYPSTAAASPT